MMPDRGDLRKAHCGDPLYGDWWAAGAPGLRLRFCQSGEIVVGLDGVERAELTAAMRARCGDTVLTSLALAQVAIEFEKVAEGA